jgi:NADH:ubiquinone oxidoreductase subunit 6 (subunit J)
MNTFPAANLLLTGVFLFCLVTLAAGALLAVFSARLIRSVSGLALCCVGLAGLYYFLNSPFLALMEILIYVGAVCVTIVFAIMLAEPEEPANSESRKATILWGGSALAVALAIFGAVGWLGTQPAWVSPANLATDGSIAAIGVSLLTTYSLAFELISLALLVAILGALAIARSGRTLPGAIIATHANGEGSIGGPGTESELVVEGAVLSEVLTMTQSTRTLTEQQVLSASRPMEESRSV